jgi:hypothetical protein
MKSDNSKQKCVCCGHMIIGKRIDADYCTNCRRHKERLYAKWRTDEKREINKYKKVIKDFKKEIKQKREDEITKIADEKNEALDLKIRQRNAYSSLINP